jgi:hypothetical protein
VTRPRRCGSGCRRPGGKNLEVFSPTIGRQLLELGLIDEVDLHIAPILFGEGSRLYDTPAGRRSASIGWAKAPYVGLTQGSRAGQKGDAVSATVLYMSMSLDGFIDGPNEGPGNGLGDGGHRLHEWSLTDHEELRRPAGVNGRGRCQPHALRVQR